ncbi:MAG: 30S ribosome-binding factor RbfA [Firmicutes bacterium]|nr:30S ribosome-binding factor RbfA [Bacillota bacterium]
MAKGYRPDRIGEEIRKIISDMLLHGLKDPRLHSLISITAVDVTSDYSYATVYFTVLGAKAGEGEDEMADVAAGFESSKGFIRRRIGSELRLKHTPELIFKADRSEEYGRHIDEIIDTLEYHNEDEEQ